MNTSIIFLLTMFVSTANGQGQVTDTTNCVYSFTVPRDSASTCGGPAQSDTSPQTQQLLETLQQQLQTVWTVVNTLSTQVAALQQCAKCGGSSDVIAAGCILDIALLIDHSGSIKDSNVPGQVDNWDFILNFCVNVVQALPISLNGPHLAAASFGNQAELDWGLTKSYDKLTLIALCNSSIPYLGGNTNTTGGMRLVRTEIFTPDGGDRPDAINVLILVTDGTPTVETDGLMDEVQRYRDAGIIVIAVGVTNRVNETLLRSIVTDPNEDYMPVTDFNKLSGTLSRLVSDACSHAPSPPPQPNTLPPLPPLPTFPTLPPTDTQPPFPQSEQPPQPQTQPPFPQPTLSRAPLPTCYPNSGCPVDFYYISAINGCYKALGSPSVWNAAALSCRQLNPCAHLVVINSDAEQNMMQFVAQTLSAAEYQVCSMTYGFWTAGKRLNPASLTSFAWQADPTRNSIAPMTYTNWKAGEPDNYQGNEDCLQLTVYNSFSWNDLPCANTLCAICEVDMS